MFATLRIGQDDQGPVCVQKNMCPGQGYQQRFACNPCREKKLKCSRDKDGCDRCRAKDLACTYLEGKPNKKGKKQTKPARSSSSSNGSGASPGASGDSSSSTSGQVNRNNKRDFTSSPRPGSVAPDRNIDPSLQLPDSDLTFSPFDKMDTTYDPLSFMKDSDFLNMHNLCHVGSDTRDSMRGSTPETSSAGDSKHSFTASLQLPPLGSDITPRNLLDLSAGSTASQYMLEDHSQMNELWDHTMSDWASPKTPGRSLNGHLEAARKNTKTSLDPSLMLNSPSHLLPLPFERGAGHRKPNGKYIRCSSCHSENRPSHCGSDFDHLKGLFSTPGSTPLLSCQCMQKALTLYEEIESRKGAATADYFLLLQKTILSECNSITGCKDCMAISGISMLLITICERLLCSFQHISDIWLDTLGYHQRPCAGSPHCRRAPGNEGVGNMQKVSIGNYSVETPREQALLVMRVIEVQLRGLCHLLTKLWDVAAHSGWEKHMSRVQRIKEQTEQTIVDLINATNDALDDFPSNMSQ